MMKTVFTIRAIDEKKINGLATTVIATQETN